MLRDLLLPGTDSGTITQWVALCFCLPVATVWLSRTGHREIARFVLGSGTLVAAWFALRALH